MTSPSSTLHPRCVITGCDLTDGESHIHGDLHELGDVYIFNACLDEEWQASRDYHNLPHKNAKVITCSAAFFFERRGVIIFPKYCTFLNQAAKDYLHV